MKSDFSLEVAKTADVAVEEIVGHDAHDDVAYAFALSRLSDQSLDHLVLGIVRQISRPTYDYAARFQVCSAQTSTASDKRRTAIVSARARHRDRRLT